MKKMIQTAVIVLGAMTLQAQSSSLLIEGTVKDEEGPLPGATVQLEGTDRGTTTGTDGTFTLDKVTPGSYTLKIKMLGYNTRLVDGRGETGEIVQHEIQLSPTTLEMDEVVVTGMMKASRVSESPVKVEVLNSDFLDRNPSSNMMESIDRVNGVKEQLACGICGTNSIRIRGMEGPYTLVLIDGMPLMSNLATVYGFNGMPSGMIDQIEIIKGPNSTLYGSEAMAGVINLRTKRPEDMPLAGLSTYYTGHGEWNADLNVAPRISDKLQSAVGINAFYNDRKLDFNEDGFTDVVLNQRFSVMNRWNIEHGFGKTSLYIRYYTEDRYGGEMEFEPDQRGSDEIYGESIRTDRLEILGSTSFGDRWRLEYSFSDHHQDSYYGTTQYVADQLTGFGQLIRNQAFGNHDILTGLSARYEYYDDNSPVSSRDRDLIPGLFIQDHWAFASDWSLVSGGRLDWHKDHGFIFSPRINMKYELDEWTRFRLNAGTGFRQVHLFTEDHSALTGSREVEILEDLEPEQSFQVGLNVNHVYQTNKYGVGTMDLDLFYTYFHNKITPDYNADPDKVVYENLDGYGISRGISFSVSHSFDIPLSIDLGTTLQEVYEINREPEGQERREDLLFAPDFSMDMALNYEWKKLGLKLSYTGQLTGPQELPLYPEPHTRDTKSDWYSLHNVKVTKSLGHHVDLFGGIKNLGNWTQPSPLIAEDEPFGSAFDTNYLYGPLQPRRFYLGIKAHLDKRKND